MTSTQHAAQHPRYPLNSYPSADLRLPSLKDLNFYRPPPGNPQDSQSAHNGTANDFVTSAPDHTPRHVQWSRSNPPTGMQSAMPAHLQHPQSQSQAQQHTPPLSAGHDIVAQAVEYNKHDGVYARPGIPLSAQVTPVPGSVNVGPAARGEDAPHSPIQPRRPRPPPTNMNPTRDGRPSHVKCIPSPIQHLSIKPTASK
ncbi:hypothetical protein P691DRAFT_766928 [Macrolepiota fuliginosa MF-IS2]|uniref:Uncharacterized protein n=1 Tax=Macrolepiota fuliginosa MF-IS2 TaxID=1400762 RepID=A0A9P6BX14_9AGAR|nr:hypothetical protein P691DRAFT_766928 [Macrolepiota fuliginosa MF-IS2]